MSEKTDTAVKVRDIADNLGQALKDARTMKNLFYDRGYNSGGADEIVDGDITSVGITAAQLSNGITLCEQLIKWADNDTPAAAVYRDTINELRTNL